VSWCFILFADETSEDLIPASVLQGDIGAFTGVMIVSSTASPLQGGSPEPQTTPQFCVPDDLTKVRYMDPSSQGKSLDSLDMCFSLMSIEPCYSYKSPNSLSRTPPWALTSLGKSFGKTPSSVRMNTPPPSSREGTPPPQQPQRQEDDDEGRVELIFGAPEEGYVVGFQSSSVLRDCYVSDKEVVEEEEGCRLRVAMETLGLDASVFDREAPPADLPLQESASISNDHESECGLEGLKGDLWQKVMREVDFFPWTMSPGISSGVSA